MKKRSLQQRKGATEKCKLTSPVFANRELSWQSPQKPFSGFLKALQQRNDKLTKSTKPLSGFFWGLATENLVAKVHKSPSQGFWGLCNREMTSWQSPQNPYQGFWGLGNRELSCQSPQKPFSGFLRAVPCCKLTSSFFEGPYYAEKVDRYCLDIFACVYCESIHHMFQCMRFWKLLRCMFLHFVCYCAVLEPSVSYWKFSAMVITHSKLTIITETTKWFDEPAPRLSAHY